MTSPISPAIDVTDLTFATEVLERSKTMPVVVDFWAPWCGPCRVLGPMIEKVAAEYAGKVALAKLNTDENPEAAAAFRIQGIPAVKAFKDGKVVLEFTGAVPEAQVRAFFKRLAPNPVQELIEKADSQFESGDLTAAEENFRLALRKEPGNAEAVVGLASLLLARGEREEAEDVLDRGPATHREVKVLKHALFLHDFEEKHGAEDLEGEAKANPKDPRALYRWGVMLAARERYEEALETLLESVRRDRNFADDAARKAMLAVFDILGLNHPVTKEYQRQLTSVLF